MLARRFLTSAAKHAAAQPSTRLAAAQRQLAAGFATYQQSARIVHKSPHPEIDLPNATIWEVLQERAEQTPDKPAVIDGLTHEEVSFRELLESSKRVAVSLAKDGVKKGDVVIVHSPNCVEYPMVLLALMSLGAVSSPASHHFKPHELAYQIRESKASYIVTHEALKSVALEAAAETGIDKRFVYTMSEESSSSQNEHLSIREMAKQGYDAFTFEKIDPDFNVLLPFSSGTTGEPKAVALSARNMLANALQVHRVQDLGDYSLGLLPFFQSYGLMLLHLSIYQGAAKVILPSFEPESFLGALEKYKIRAVHCFPPTAHFLAHDPLADKYDLSATEFLISGGAPMGTEIEGLVKDRVNVTVKQTYGTTELSPVVNYSEDGYRKPGSVGRLVPNTELRVRCVTTNFDLPVGHKGELLFRGPQVMIGYSNDRKANSNVFTDDGFVRTGDFGYIDEDGFVFIVDRVKELIKYKGHRIAPTEIEDILVGHPHIKDACCVRGKDTVGQEIAKAFVVLKDPTNAAGVTDVDVINFVAQRSSAFKKIRRAEFVDEIPRSASSKILRRLLQEREDEQDKE